MKIFLLSFTLFLSAYLWATTFTLTNETVAVESHTPATNYCDDDDDDTGASAGCVKSLSDLCSIFTNFSDDQCFEKSVNACDNDIKADCVKDMAIYCDYNTSFSNTQCWEKAINACDGKPGAMREISEAAKNKSLEEVQKLTL